VPGPYSQYGQRWVLVTQAPEPATLGGTAGPQQGHGQVLALQHHQGCLRRLLDSTEQHRRKAPALRTWSGRHTFSGIRAVPRMLTFCGEEDVAEVEANHVAQTRSPRVVTTSPSCTTACVLPHAMAVRSTGSTPPCRSAQAGRHAVSIRTCCALALSLCSR